MATTSYKQPQSVPVPNCNGYPNNVKSTQTALKRGVGAATKGTKYNPNPK